MGEADRFWSLSCACSQPGDVQGCCELHTPLARADLPQTSQDKVAQDQGFFPLRLLRAKYFRQSLVSRSCIGSSTHPVPVTLSTRT